MNLEDNIDDMIVADIIGGISSTEKIILDSLLAGDPAVRERYDYIHQELTKPEEPRSDGYATAAELIAIVRQRELKRKIVNWIIWITLLALLGCLVLRYL